MLQGTSPQYNCGQCNLKSTITSPTERQCNCTDLLPALYADTVFTLEVQTEISYARKNLTELS